MYDITIRDYPEEVGRIIERILVRDYTLTGYYVDGNLLWRLLYTGDRDVRILELAISEYIVESIWTMPLSTSSKGLKSYYKSLKSIGFSSVRWRTTARKAPYDGSLGPVWPVVNHHMTRFDFLIFPLKFKRLHREPHPGQRPRIQYILYRTMTYAIH